MNKNILLAGASGLVGNNLLNILQKNDSNLVLISRKKVDAKKEIKQIVTNFDELEQLKKTLNIVHHLLEPKSGRLAIISFHSLEDRIVKNHIRDNSSQKPRNRWELEERTSPLWLQISKKVIKPSANEIHNNPRARSARLRVAEALPIMEEIE